MIDLKIFYSHQFKTENSGKLDYWNCHITLRHMCLASHSRDPKKKILRIHTG